MCALEHCVSFKNYNDYRKSDNYVINRDVLALYRYLHFKLFSLLFSFEQLNALLLLAARTRTVTEVRTLMLLIVWPRLSVSHSHCVTRDKTVYSRANRLTDAGARVARAKNSHCVFVITFRPKSLNSSHLCDARPCKNDRRQPMLYIVLTVPVGGLV